MIISQFPCGTGGGGSLGPRYEFTGQYRENVDSQTGDWEIYLLTSGTLRFKRDTDIDIFAVGGGGAGGASASSGATSGDVTYYRGGGGGGGGYTTTQSGIQIAAFTQLSVVIGAGGLAEDAEHANGGETSVSNGNQNVITAAGGYAAPTTGYFRGGNGGSGGGSGGCSGLADVDGGVGGTDGGNGGNRAHGSGANEGQGTTTKAFGTGELYSGGGGGGAGRMLENGAYSNTTRGAGGAGGGGAGGTIRTGGANGASNTGGGGGGGGANYGIVGYTSSFPGGNGGSGIVIIRNARG